MYNVIIGKFVGKGKIEYHVNSINCSIENFLYRIKSATDRKYLVVLYFWDDIEWYKYDKNFVRRLITKEIFDMEIDLISNLENHAMTLKLPFTLYHATLKSNLPSIEKYGLGGNTTNKLWDSQTDYFQNYQKGVFLADNPDVARDFVESSEYYDDEDIVIFEIYRADLELSNLFIDPNVIDNLTGDESIATWFYNDIIDYNKLNVVYY